MPEGHTIHRLAADLTSTLAGAEVRASSPQGRFTSGAAAIDGAHLRRADAYGKYLFCQFDDVLLHVHLGLIGKFRPTSPMSEPRDTIRLRLANDATAWDLTGPARCELVDPGEERRITSLLGPDPLRSNSGLGRFRRALATSRAPIGAALLDQRVIAGIGNVYRAELLFICGIHPSMRSSSLDDDQVAALWRATRHQLRRGVRLGRIVTTDPREIGRPLERIAGDDRLYVYHRTNCRWCGSDLRTIELGGRPLQYCPEHQPDPGASLATPA